MGTTTSDFKIRIILYKFVPIKFFDAKNGPHSNQTRFFVLLHLHTKVIIIVFFCFVFLFKGGPPWTFILWMNKY